MNIYWYLGLFNTIYSAKWPCVLCFLWKSWELTRVGKACWEYKPVVLPEKEHVQEQSRKSFIPWPTWCRCLFDKQVQSSSFVTLLPLLQASGSVRASVGWRLALETSSAGTEGARDFAPQLWSAASECLQRLLGDGCLGEWMWYRGVRRKAAGVCWGHGNLSWVSRTPLCFLEVAGLKLQREDSWVKKSEHCVPSLGAHEYVYDRV